jgi:hypothetical protein
MTYCGKYKLNVESEFNCKYNCILWNSKKNKCNFNQWVPGLKNGKDLSNENTKN